LHVSYQFCNLPVEITVMAENADEARAKAVEQLRVRGLKVALPLLMPDSPLSATVVCPDFWVGSDQS
jgi:hypothetical protein